MELPNKTKKTVSEMSTQLILKVSYTSQRLYSFIMRELKNSKVHFSNSDKVYKSGDILNGQVEINLDSPETVKSVFITICGKATVYWSESETTTEDGQSITRQVTYSNKEQYFKENIPVLRNENDSKIDIPAGQHVYPFKYLLPPNLPPTYGDKQSIGKIIYKVKATLERPWKINKHVQEQFIVEASTFQNASSIKEPQIMKIDKQFGLIFKSKPLIVTVKTPQYGFHKGHVIPLTIDVNNQSDTTVKSISVKLIEISKFYATTKTNTTEKTMSKNHIKSQIKSKGASFFNHELTVPSDWVLTDMSNCKIIDVLYAVKVELHTAGLTKNLVGNMYLIPIK